MTTVLIPGAVSSTYELQPDDTGCTIFCRVTGTNSYGLDVADSNIVGPVTAEGPFTPADLPGLVAWYDATVGVYSNSGGTTPTTDGGNVVRWNDQSGNGCHLLNSTGGIPTYDTTAYNGHPAVMFVPADDLRTVPDTVPQGGSGVFCVFMVCRIDTGQGANPRYMSYVGNGNSPATDYADATSAIPLIVVVSGGYVVSGYRASVLTANASISLDTNYRFANIITGTSQAIYVNNVAGTPTAETFGALGSPGMFWIGAGPNGPICEIIVTNVAPDAVTLTQIDDYFTAKWGV